MDRRLQLIYDMVEPTDTVADVGTDHGYLICSLVEGEKAKRGIATDINKMPLESAIAEISKLGLQDKIKTYLTDGLNNVNDDIDAVTIAGMGGELIERIIIESDYKAHPDRIYYLQPMTKPHLLRQFLYQNGFMILEERCTVAGNKPYSVIKTVFKNSNDNYDLFKLYVGNINKADIYAKDYIEKILEQLSKKISGYKHSQNDIEYNKYNDLYEKIKTEFKL